MGTCANLYKSSIDNNIILTFENNNVKINSNNFKAQKNQESNNSFITDFSISKKIINKNRKNKSVNETKKENLSNNDEIIKSLEKIDSFFHNNLFDEENKNGSIIINNLDLHLIGIKYEHNNINDWKSETKFNKKKINPFIKNKSEKNVNCPIYSHLQKHSKNKDKI